MAAARKAPRRRNIRTRRNSQWKAFLSMLDRPAQVKPELVRLFREAAAREATQRRVGVAVGACSSGNADTLVGVTRTQEWRAFGSGLNRNVIWCNLVHSGVR